MPDNRKLLILALVLLVLIAVFALPVFPYAVSFGYWPSGLALLIVVVIVLLVAAGQM